MNVLNPKIDFYLADGCGRCSLYKTSKCKVHKWVNQLKLLRQIAIDCGLTEELKWSFPTYTHQNKNILMISAFNDYCSINFFKGSLLNDSHKILSQPTENVQATRQLRFTDYNTIIELQPIIKAYIHEAIEVEKAGLKVNFKPVTDYEIPTELENKFTERPDFKIAFYKLTAGKQKGYLLHFAAAKQSKTRESRIEICIPKIIDGKGFHDYKK